MQILILCASPGFPQVSSSNSSLQVGFAGANLDPALAGAGVGEDAASWAVDGIRRCRLHQPGGPAAGRSGRLQSEEQPVQSSAPFAVGDRVEGKYKNGNWFPAIIFEQESDGRFQLRWDDGDPLDRIKSADELRRYDPEAGGGSAAAAEEATAEVEGDWGGHWKVGDVIGVACDLDRGALLVSVNGDLAAPNGLAFSVGVRPGPVVGASLFPALSGRGVRVAYCLGGAAAARPLRYLAEGYAPVLQEHSDGIALHLESFSIPPHFGIEMRAAAEAEEAAAAEGLRSAEASAAAARRAQVAAVLAAEVPEAAQGLRGEFEAMFARQKALPAEVFNKEAEYKALIVEAIDAKVLQVSASLPYCSDMESSVSDTKIAHRDTNLLLRISTGQ
jgi:hypothetical protein